MTTATNSLGDTPPTVCPVCTGPCTFPGEGPTGQLGGLCTVCGWDYLTARPGGSACPSDRLQRGGSGMSIWGRVQVGGQWRPAYISTAGFFVSPHIGGPWRPGTSRERAGFQERIACHQHTTGRIWDDELYTAPAIVVSGVE